MRIQEIIDHAELCLFEGVILPYELEADGTSVSEEWTPDMGYDLKVAAVENLFGALNERADGTINVYNKPGGICAMITVRDEFIEDWTDIERLSAFSNRLKNHRIVAIRPKHGQMKDDYDEIKKFVLKYAVECMEKLLAEVQRDRTEGLVIERFELPAAD